MDDLEEWSADDQAEYERDMVNVRLEEDEEIDNDVEESDKGEESDIGDKDNDVNNELAQLDILDEPLLEVMPSGAVVPVLPETKKRTQKKITNYFKNVNLN